MPAPVSHSITTRRLFALSATCCFLFVLGIVAFLTRITQTIAPAPLFDPRARHSATLSAPLRSWLQAQTTPLSATLFMSADERLPAHLKAVGSSTRQLLSAMQEAAGNRMRTRVVDPDLSGDEGAAYAARARVSPVRVRKILDDRTSETTIWSSLVLSRAGHADVLIQDIQAQHLPHLQPWILSHLQAASRAPRFAVDVPEGYRQVAAHLAQHGPVMEIDFDRGARLPPDIDLFIWVQPDKVSDAHVARLRSFLASGRSVVLAGSPYRMVHVDESHVSGLSNGPAWPALLRAFGLRATPDLLMDRNHGPVVIPLDSGPVELRAPYHLRNLPAFRDFRPFATQARGGLAFAGAGALQIDTELLQDSGWRAHVAATTTQFATVTDVPVAPVRIDELRQELRVPKQNLMVLLTSEDPWAGQMLVLAAPTPFADGSLSQTGYGHGIFLRDLVRSLAAGERLIRIDVDRQTARPLASTTSGERLLWRLLLIGAVPALWIWLAVRRLGILGQIRFAVPSLRPMVIVGVIVLAGVWLAATGLDRPRLDLTADDLHSLTDETLESLASLPDLQVEWVVSSNTELPIGMKRAAARFQDAMSSTGLDLTIHRLDGNTPTSQRQHFVKAGIRPFAVERVAHDTTRVDRVVSGLLLRSGLRQTAIPRIDERTLPHLDFLLVAAIERLRQNRTPRLTVVSDLPRLSPAEALEDYQKKGLSAPRGVDVYSHAKQLLRDYGYTVQHVSLREPQFPRHSDAVLWFQPRRDASAIVEALSEHLSQGGKAVVALQHYNIQQRQYRGAGFSTVHWPQPQFQDLVGYLELIGVEQPREVLMDRSQHALQLDTQVNRSAVREYDAQQVALPFLLRSVAHQHDVDDELTRRLGDLLFIWGNRFQLTGAGSVLDADTLVTTSAHAWSYDWRGGWLPPEAFEPATYLGGPQPLVLRLRGLFPAIHAVRDSTGSRRFGPGPASTAEGQLVLIGSSEMFKDPYLLRAPFAHDQLLLNAVADAVYGADMLALQARAGGGRRGFEPPADGERFAWRLAVVGMGPGLFALLGLWRWGRRRSG